MHKILANTVFLGKDIIYLTECHSTNDIAAQKIKDGAAKEGSIIITDKQTKGRGQRGNRWFSEPEVNLTFSLVLSPLFLNARSHFELNRVVSLAVLEVFSALADGIKVKWPNDIVHEKEGKLGGILIENSISRNNIESSIVGIGLNINQLDFPFPGPTSLAKLSGQIYDKWEIMGRILSAIEKRYLQLKKNDLKQLHSDYLNNLYLKDVWSRYEDIDGRFTGRIVGVSDEGKLLIEKNNRDLNHYVFKEVKFI
ncbi:biotin--[acetyl-CoA-carboxylase] ligase [Echinicola marina]|uniref:biotin--[acetyl-CoA-carboxylase] ligase n=1 Tax=Echinicola marina TaxID=2859768 RepID=UPI001CF6485C|nr:biotin--[acetyl-CoA-carboxylase] ligase [Echinicola marina]UCS91521.1 biotin--[acetyl-CoA-carboxylase] ligase [Echinicola marina]